MMATGAFMDLASLILICLAFLSLIFRKMTNGRSAKLFMIMTICGMVASAVEFLTFVFEDIPSFSAMAISILRNVFYIVYALQLPLFFAFVVSVTDSWHKIEKYPFLYILLQLPYSALPITILVCSVNGGADLAQESVRNTVFFVTIAVAFFYMLTDLAYIIRYRNQLGLRRIVALTSVIVFYAASFTAYDIFSDLIVQNFMTALSLIVVSIGILRPEDYVDSCTGLFKQKAYADLMRNGYKNQKHVIVVMINIGNYDAIYGMLGYDSTNAVTYKIAQKINEVNRRIKGRADLYYLDTCRFRMVFNTRDADKAEIAADVLMTELKSRSRHNGFDINLAPYITVARCPEDIESFNSLMSFGRVFHKKYQYSGRVIPISDIYNPDEFAIQNEIDNIIKRALENQSFEVYYQPIYSITEKRFVSAEALLRLKDEKYGFINPELIVTAAERNGAIHKIGDFVFEEVCRFVSSDEYKRLGLDYIEVNLSVAQCMHSDLAYKILKTMQKYNVDPGSINLEITETAASFSQKAMADNLNRLSAAGLSFSLDDYGTGYSNMKRVIQLPLKIVKLDKSFVDEQSNPKMWIFLQNTVKMLKDMEMEIVVEGIETQEMVEAFSNLKCDFIQGYFFSKPICKDDFVEFITTAADEK